MDGGTPSVKAPLDSPLMATASLAPVMATAKGWLAAPSAEVAVGVLASESLLSGVHVHWMPPPFQVNGA